MGRGSLGNRINKSVISVDSASVLIPVHEDLMRPSVSYLDSLRILRLRSCVRLADVLVTLLICLMRDN
jgi:hypothetical protein